MAHGNYLWLNWQPNGDILIDLEIQSATIEEKLSNITLCAIRTNSEIKEEMHDMCLHFANKIFREFWKGRGTRDQIANICWIIKKAREFQKNMYITICELDHQSKFNAWNRVLKASALVQPWGMGWGGRWEGAWDRGHMYTHGWIHVNIWQKPLQYCKVISLQLNKLIKNIYLSNIKCN